MSLCHLRRQDPFIRVHNLLIPEHPPAEFGPGLPGLQSTTPGSPVEFPQSRQTVWQVDPVLTPHRSAGCPPAS